MNEVYQGLPRFNSMCACACMGTRAHPRACVYLTYIHRHVNEHYCGSLVWVFIKSRWFQFSSLINEQHYTHIVDVRKLRIAIWRFQSIIKVCSSTFRYNWMSTVNSRLSATCNRLMLAVNVLQVLCATVYFTYPQIF